VKSSVVVRKQEGLRNSERKHSSYSLYKTAPHHVTYPKIGMVYPPQFARLR